MPDDKVPNEPGSVTAARLAADMSALRRNLGLPQLRDLVAADAATYAAATDLYITLGRVLGRAAGQRGKQQ
jgi:hypothetical protein